MTFETSEEQADYAQAQQERDAAHFKVLNPHTTPAAVADACAKPMPETEQTTMHATEWAQRLALALESHGNTLATRFWRVEPVTGDSESNQTVRCYLREYQQNGRKPRLMAQLYVARWEDNGGTMRVSCADDPTIGELRYPDRFGILDGDASWASRADAVVENLLTPAREARTARIAPPKPALSEAIAQAVAGARPSFTAVPFGFTPSDLAALQQHEAKAKTVAPATQETLAGRLRALAEELTDQLTRDEKTAKVFREGKHPSTRYAAHYDGRAEGYAYAVQRIMALVDEAEPAYTLTEKGKEALKAGQR